MDCLLISGYPSTGKNLTTVRVAHFLLDIGYEHADGDPIPLRGTGDNFTAILKHPNSKKQILLNTKADFEVNAHQLIVFYRAHEPIDILITSIRDAGPERNTMENEVRHLQPINLVEIPLARISGHRPDFNQALIAYLGRVEDLVKFILQGVPFQV